jgi:hypothetical protein
MSGSGVDQVLTVVIKAQYMIYGFYKPLVYRWQYVVEPHAQPSRRKPVQGWAVALPQPSIL